MKSTIVSSGQFILLILAITLLLFFWRSVVGAKDYQRLKNSTDTRDRQKIMAKWVLESIILFGFGAFIILYLIGRFSAIMQFPGEFAVLVNEEGSANDRLILSFVLSASLLVGSIIGVISRNKGQMDAQEHKDQVTNAADFTALIPRNNTEGIWAALLSLSAGVTEELMFRLALPLLLTLIMGNVLTAFAISIVIFGMMHFYQGRAGVLGTTFAALIFSVIYFTYGGLLLPIIVHTLIDMIGLLLTPWVVSRRTG